MNTKSTKQQPNNSTARRSLALPTASVALRSLFIASLIQVAVFTHADVISDWNNTAIVAIKAVNPNAVLASRALAMTHVAQFDAVNAVVHSYTPYAAHLSAPGASPEAAAAQAAYVVLTNLYPAQLALLDAALTTSLGSVPDGQPKTDGIALGQASAAAILARRANDGSAVTVPYVPGTGPGVWIPTPPALAPALLPNWRFVAPWTMTAPEQFRPGPPPALDSATYTADFTEMKSIGETNSTTRTAEQTAIGLFHIEFVPYTLGSAARFAVAARPLPLIESARMFALLNMAMADSVISVWDGKFHYNYWRPVTAIRAADTDGNPATEPDPAWTPLRATPPHPEYPAAHTIIAAAGAAVLASVFGDEFTFTIESPTLPGQPRTFARFSDFPVESSNARVWAGFHWRNSTIVAAQMGAAIGQQAVTKHLRNTQPPTFTKITTGAIVNDVGSSNGGAWADYDGDGDLDLVVANGTFGGARVKNFLYQNNGNGTFTKVTTGAIVSDDVDSVTGAWADYDNDGHPDLFVSNKVLGNDLLYRNNGGGSFTKITTGPVVNDGRYAAFGAWADFDNDGHLDLYVTEYQSSSRVNRLYRNNGDGTFSRVTNSPAVTDRGDWIGADWADYDDDGYIDLFVCRNDQRNNALYRNTGNGSFTKNTTVSPANEGPSGTCSWVDYDNDGFFDLFVGNGRDPGQYNFLYHNNGDGTFTKITSDIITDDFGTWVNSTWGDYDNDGFIDVFVANRTSNSALYRNNGDGTFTKITTGNPVEELSTSRGCSWADYDNDGFLDLFVGNGWGGPAQDNFLYRNDGNANAWLKVKLVGTQSNRSAIGAKVRVTAKIRGSTIRQLRQVSGGAGGQNSLLVHFGLGDATNVDTVRIEWPSGIVQELKNVTAKQMMTVIEPPKLEPSVKLLNGMVELKVRGWKGFTYAIEGSSDLKTWQWLGTATNFTGTLQATDAEAGGPQRFYRVVVP